MTVRLVHLTTARAWRAANALGPLPSSSLVRSGTVPLCRSGRVPELVDGRFPGARRRRWLDAAADDWPRRWYARVGFDVVARRHELHIDR